MTLVFGDLKKISLNGTVGTEVWLERRRGSGARDAIFSRF